MPDAGSPLVYIPSYVEFECGQGGVRFPLALYCSPKSWYDQSENHEVTV